MSTLEIIALVVTLIGVTCFSAVITLLYASYSKETVESIKAGKKDVELIGTIVKNSEIDASKREKRRKIREIVITVILSVVTIPFLCLALFDRIGGNVTSFGDTALMVVASGSMSKKHESNDYLNTNHLDNQFQTYDIILLDTKEDFSSLEIYDIIAYRNDEKINIIHRIIQIENTAEGVRYVTRGDANNSTDRYHPKAEDVIGVYKDKRIPIIGIFILFFQSPSGLVTFIALVYCLLMLDRFSSKIHKAESERMDLIQTSIDDQLEGEEFEAQYYETIVYNGKRYHFDEEGFVGLEDIEEVQETEQKSAEEEKAQDESERGDSE